MHESAAAILPVKPGSDNTAARSSHPAPRRILFVDHTAKLGGGEIALLNLVRHLDPTRYTPLVLLFSEGPLKDRLEEAGIQTHVLPLSPSIINTRKDTLGTKSLLRPRDIFAAVRFIRRLRQFMRAQNIALVHTNSLKADVLAGIAARLAGIPVLWHVRDRIDADYLPGGVVRVFRWLCRIVPDFVIANSAATLDTLALASKYLTATVHSGIELAGRISIVHDGMQYTKSPTASAPSSRRGQLIGLIGRITPWKGQHIFLKAAAQVLKRYPETRFQIIGAALFAEQPYEDQVKALAKSLGLENAVEFTGFRNDVPQLIDQLDIVVHASTTGEPFGQVVIEGMAAGKPVVATNGGGIPEIVVDGVTGLLVPMGDSVAMATAICRLLEDPQVAQRMGRFARQRVIEHFTIENTVAKIQSLYDDILDAKNAAAGGSSSLGEFRPPAPRSLFQSLLDVMPIRKLRPRFDRAAALRHGVMLAAITSAMLLSIVIHYYWPTHSPTFVAFMGSVAVAAWVGGIGSGFLSLLLSSLLIAYFILPPDNSLAIGPEDRPRFYIFVVTGLLIIVLIEMMHAANRRMKNAREQAEATHRRMAFLAKAATAVSVTLDYDSALKNLAYLANSEISDWCMIDVLKPDGTVRRAHVAHKDPEKTDLARALLHYPPDMSSEQRLAKALRSGCAELSSIFSNTSLEVGIRDPHHLQLLRDLGHRSYMIIPLVAGGETLGAITFVSTSYTRFYDRDDLALATELTLRAALALDNAKTFSALRDSK